MFKDELVNNLHELYRNDSYINSLFNAAGITLDNLADNIQDVLNQYDFTKMTWGIPILENRMKFKTNSNSSIENRRSQLEARWKSSGKSDIYLLQTVANSWKNGDVTVSFINGKIIITFISKNGFSKNLEDIYEAMEIVKPAHLPISYDHISVTSMNIYYAAASISGETITVYPWTPREIESRGKINVATAVANNTEIVTVYPKEG